MNVRDCQLIEAIVAKDSDTVQTVAQMLFEAKQRRCIIVNSEHKPLGIISTTDMNNKVVANAVDAKATLAKEIMSAPLFLQCTLDDSLENTYAKMKEHQSYFVPVVDEQGKLFAILTYGEMVAQLKEAIQHGRTTTSTK